MPEKTKSEIAERAMRRILDATWRYTHQDESGEIWQDAVKASAAVKLIVERAIAESRGQPCPHLNRVKSTEPDSATLCTDCDTYLPKSELGDGEPSSAPPHKLTPTNGNIYLCRVCHQPGYDCTGESGAAQEVSPPSPVKAEQLLQCAEWVMRIQKAGCSCAHCESLADRIRECLIAKAKMPDTTTTRIPCGVQDHADAAQIVGGLKFEIIKYNAVCWKVYLGNSYLGSHNTEQQAANFVKNLEINMRKFVGGDTRELKAALESIIQGAMAAEVDTRCHICRPGDDHRHEEGCPILAAERIMGKF